MIEMMKKRNVLSYISIKDLSFIELLDVYIYRTYSTCSRASYKIDVSLVEIRKKH